ncbi:MAG: TatD family hydrolase [Candidatus Levybacteria bacterium]|nr:TatD family hydrolase [Candidatus Levybacteria bacterium]
MIDTHCHLNFHKFENDIDEVIGRALEAGVEIIVNTGTSIPSSRQAVELAQKYSQLYAIVGIHPHHADKADKEFEGEIQNDWLEKLEELARQPKVIGIGEIGMDYWNYRSNGIVDNTLQEDAFRKQIELSIQLGLPIQIHTRLAWDDTLSILGDYSSKLQRVPGMFHCFSGSIDFARKVLEMGFYVGFDGNITYGGIPPRETTSLIDLVDYVPLDRILTETDSPFLSPVPKRGTRNEPQNVIIVSEFIADRKKVPLSNFNKIIHDNFNEVFGKKLKENDERRS